jgi:hypothetical protein
VFFAYGVQEDAARGERHFSKEFVEENILVELEGAIEGVDN